MGVEVLGFEVWVPHPRDLCEGGGFDFRPRKPVVTKIDSQQSEVFLERAVLTMRNHRQQPQKSKRKRACPDQCFSFNPLAVIAIKPKPGLLVGTSIGRRSVEHSSSISQSDLAGARHL